MGPSIKYVKHFGICLLLTAFSVSSISCALLRRGGPSDDVLPGQNAARDRSHAEVQLRRMARSDFQEAEHSQDDSSRKLIFRKPYHYKERVEYPQGPDSFRVVIHDKESRTVPYSAEVTIRKIRYSTVRQKKKVDAETDVNFQRDTGLETVSYEYRAGKWKRIGSMFVAESREDDADAS